MSLFCRHRWVEQMRQGVEGALEAGADFEFGGGLWGPAASDALYGYTLIELKCSRCGDVRVRKLCGTLP